MKYSVAHYKKSDSDWWINGGKLIISENKCILRCFLKTVAEFTMDECFVVHKIPDQMFFKGINITDGNKSYDLLLYPKTALQLYRQFHI